VNNRWFYISIVSVVLLLNIYPFYQLVSTKGYLFYTNAYDESSYLQYDFSRATQSPARVVQYLVTLSHELGLSGGRMNLIFDLVALPVFMFFTSRCFYCVGFDRKTSNLYSFLLTVLPLAFCRSNPLIHDFFVWSRETGYLQWVTSPDSTFLPLVRTPEPQFSLAILSMVIFFSLQKKSFWYLYPVLPFLYPFVGVPTAFIIVALHLRHLFPNMTQRIYLAPFLSYCLIGLGVWTYVTILTSETTLEFLVATRLPLVSLAALECLVIALWGYRRCEPKFRFLLVVVSAAPLAVTNLQIISGWLGAPHSYEQNFSTLCVSFVLLLSIGPLNKVVSLERKEEFHVKRRKNIRSLTRVSKLLLRPQQLSWILFVLCMGLVLLSGRSWFRINYLTNSNLPLTKEVLNAFHSKSERVVIDNQQLAAVTNMIFPRQPSTLLGYERSFANVCTDEGVRDYLLAKKTIHQNEAIADQFRDIFVTLDNAYRFEGADFYLLHNFRKKEFRQKHDTSLVPEENDTRELFYVFIDNEKNPPRPRQVILNWIKNSLSQVDKLTAR
jgi:hypothetical protein